MDVMDVLKERGEHCRCIRCREVKGQKIDRPDLRLVDNVYHTPASEEHFIQFVTPPTPGQPDGFIAGYLRLSLPLEGSPDLSGTMPELAGAAIIREVHVYGQSLAVGAEQAGAAQHVGLGTALIDESVRVAAERGYAALAVISAVGTRLYYERRGFERREYYMVRKLG
jgi:elongator complex protein 3